MVPVMNILIIRLSAIGDVIHALPAVPLLKQHYPGCRITWLVEEKAAGLLEEYPGIDRVLVSRRQSWLAALGRGTMLQAAKETAAFVRDVRQQRYDLVLDFQGLLKSGLAAGLVRAVRKVGFDNAREGSRLFYHEQAPAAECNDHAIKRHMALLEYLGIPAAEPRYAFPLDGVARQVADLLEREGIDRQRPYMCVHPRTLWKTKMWSPGKTAGLCARLVQDHDCRVLLTGGKGDAGECERIRAEAGKGVYTIAGKTSLRESACLLADAALLVTVDSGPMHLACAVGTPVVALFGPTAPWRTGPFGKEYSVVRKEMDCSPCYSRKKCPVGHHRCMDDISVDEVVKVCCNYLTK